MEEKPSESKQEENNKQTENIETSEDLTEAASVQTAEKETKPAPDITAALEEDEGEQDTFSVAPLEGALEEDVSMMTPIAETSEFIAAEIESELYMMTEEDAGIPLFDDTFDDYSNTEGLEEGRLIAELLSQEDTMAAEDEEEENRPPTPERDGGYSPAGIPLVPAEEEEVDLSINNKEHIELLHELQAERDKLSKLNGQLQAKIAEYLSKNIRHDEQPRLEKDISNQEQYQKYLNLMEDLKSQHHQISERLQQRTAELQVQSQEKVDQVEDELRSFAAIKNEAAITALSGKLGKQAAMAKVEELLAAEQKQEDELVVVRLKNIKLKYKISKFKAALHSKQELAEGLLLMDFEQLKTENQTFKNKLKERSEELLKLKKKVACTVQGITHVKEKMHFVQIENKTKYTQLAEADALVALKRDVLTRTRQARDSLRADNLKLQQRCGLLGNNTLLRDFEEKVDTSECLQQRLEILKRRHAELIMKCAGVKKKIEQSKPESK